jgi:hypothetical protein
MDQKAKSRRAALEVGPCTGIGAAIGLLFGTMLLGIAGSIAGAAVGLVMGLIWDEQTKEPKE